jgi:hypothetical protein
MKVRKILEDNIKVAHTAGETFEILKQKIEEAGFMCRCLNGVKGNI